MLCDKCQKNPATVHMTQIINGVKEESHLCEECARENGIDLSFDALMHPISFQDLFADFLNAPAQELFETRNVTRCPQCGMSLRELRESGRLGCPTCYDTFRPQLEGTLKSIHGNARHRGKLAKNAGQDLLERKELESLKKQLTKAIAAEEYEEAAKLRDQIHKLEKGA